MARPQWRYAIRGERDRGDPVEEALGIAIKIAQPFGLQAIGD
jgi:hypothetical protein